MELEKCVTDNTKRLDKIEPLVINHEKALYGDRDDRKDEGLVGAMNNIEEFVDSARGWIKWTAMTVIGFCLIGIIKLLLDTAVLLQAVP